MEKKRSKKSKIKYVKENLERRQLNNLEFIDFEENEDEGIIEGYAAIYNSETIIDGCFKEVIAPGAFDDTDLDDVAFYCNHELNRIPLARSRRNNPTSTLYVKPDMVGLRTKARVDKKENQEARTLMSAIKRGDVLGMSYLFEVGEEEWKDIDTEMPTRIIKKVSKVIEVSAVNYPAYEDTTIYARAKNSLDNEKRALDNARARLEVRKKRISIKTKI